MMNALRLRYGMFWPGKYPPIPWKQVAVTLLCMLTYLAVTTIDDLEARVEIMDRALQIEGAKASVLRNCERGASGYYYPDGRTYLCPQDVGVHGEKR